MKMRPDCPDPKVSDGEPVSLSMRKPRFDPGLLHVGFAGVKYDKRADFLKQY